MRAVNNTLWEIILRERPLTVTNNWSRARPHSNPRLTQALFPRAFFQTIENASGSGSLQILLVLHFKVENKMLPINEQNSL